MRKTLAALSVLVATATSCSRSAPANVAATVNGRAITYAELEKQFQSQFATPAGSSSDDQMEIQKLEVLRTLVDGEIMLQRAERQGEDFAQIAQNYSEDPNSSQNGGDLGFIAESALEKANIELRKAVMALRPGEITPIQRTAEGYRILKLVTREPAGQRDLTDPKVQQTIRETLINRKDQLLKAAYYEVARNEAKVVNYFATRIVGNREKK